jgi:hypothetical protein
MFLRGRRQSFKNKKLFWKPIFGLQNRSMYASAPTWRGDEVGSTKAHEAPSIASASKANAWEMWGFSWNRSWDEAKGHDGGRQPLQSGSTFAANVGDNLGLNNDHDTSDSMVYKGFGGADSSSKSDTVGTDSSFFNFNFIAGIFLGCVGLLLAKNFFK